MDYLHQQINLYQPLFRKQRKMFSFMFSLQATALFMVALSVIYILNLNSVSHLQQKLLAQKQQNQQRLSQLASLSDEIAKYKGATTHSRVGQLKQELEAEKFLLSVLGEVYASHSKGFAAYLEGFSRRVIDGLWISRFDMLNGGKQVKLVGGALKPDAIPRFIDNLKEEEALRGTKFQILEIDRADKNKNWVKFSLASDNFSETPFDVKE